MNTNSIILPTKYSVDREVKKILSEDQNGKIILFGVWHYETFEEFSAVDPGNKYINTIRDMYSLGKDECNAILMENDIFL